MYNLKTSASLFSNYQVCFFLGPNITGIVCKIRTQDSSPGHTLNARHLTCRLPMFICIQKIKTEQKRTVHISGRYDLIVFQGKLRCHDYNQGVSGTAFPPTALMDRLMQNYSICYLIFSKTQDLLLSINQNSTPELDRYSGKISDMMYISSYHYYPFLQISIFAGLHFRISISILHSFFNLFMLNL